MKIIESIEEMREYSQQLKNDGKTIGLIDTEGCLHDGHMFLVKFVIIVDVFFGKIMLGDNIIIEP
jgi:pantothenate synthetase